MCKAVLYFEIDLALFLVFFKKYPNGKSVAYGEIYFMHLHQRRSVKTFLFSPRAREGPGAEMTRLRTEKQGLKPFFLLWKIFKWQKMYIHLGDVILLLPRYTDQFLEYLRTLSLKFQKAPTKIEVVLALPSWLSQYSRNCISQYTLIP